MNRVIADSQVKNYFLKASRTALLEYIGGLRQALQRYTLNPDIIPPRIVQTTPDGTTLHMFMPVIDDVFSGVKTLGYNASSGEGFTGVVNVTDSHSGSLVGVVMAKQLTAVRTAMTSCIGLVDQIKRFGSHVEITAFGTGLQVFWHVVLAYRLLEAKSVTINVVYRSAPMDVASLQSLLPNANFVQVQLDDKNAISEAVSHSDVIFGCVPSQQPALLLRDLEKSNRPSFTYVSLIGSYKPHMHECDGALIERFQAQHAKIIVDSKEHTLLEAGELIDAQVAPSELVEVGELGADSKITMKCENGKQVNLCKIVGLSIMDISVAKILLANLSA